MSVEVELLLITYCTKMLTKRTMETTFSFFLKFLDLGFKWQD